MATPFTYMLVAIATACCTVAAPANARADELKKGYPPAELAELVKWHSDITVISESCASPEWKSALIEIDPEQSVAFRAWHGADAPAHAAKDGSDSSAASFDPPKGDRKSARNPAANR